MSVLIANSMRAVVYELIERGEILLVEGGSAEKVGDELVAARQAHDGFGHAGSFVSSVLMK